jgi:hypothetical protein
MRWQPRTFLPHNMAFCRKSGDLLFSVQRVLDCTCTTRVSLTHILTYWSSSCGDFRCASAFRENWYVDRHMTRGVTKVKNQQKRKRKHAKGEKRCSWYGVFDGCLFERIHASALSKLLMRLITRLISASKVRADLFRRIQVVYCTAYWFITCENNTFARARGILFYFLEHVFMIMMRAFNI